MPEKLYDVLIAGGSISGLLTAREVASAGFNVAVFEEDSEIGTPEHCGGLVSIGGLKRLGALPSISAIENTIKKARISSQSKSFELNTERQNIIVIDRREFDKQVAFQAQSFGAEIRTKSSVRSIIPNYNNDLTLVKTSEGDFLCHYFIDARGISSIINRDRTGVLQSAQYEVYAPWIDGDVVVVDFDSEKYPGFFAWIIPTGQEKGKIGVAGRGINAAAVLGKYIEEKGGKYSIIRKVYAPIWISGPIQDFVSGHSIAVGDAAGQTKPTTAGGIYSCGLGGVFAGRAVAAALDKSDDTLLDLYQKNWSLIFKNEFDKMLLARKLLERLDNKALDELFATVSEASVDDISVSGDFDFHSAAVSKILGAKGAAKIAKMVLGNEIRRLVG